MRLNCLLKKSRPGRLARLFTAEKRQRSRARERDEIRPPKMSAAQRMARRRVRALFREIADDLLSCGLLDELIEILRTEVDR